MGLREQEEYSDNLLFLFFFFTFGVYLTEFTTEIFTVLPDTFYTFKSILRKKYHNIKTPSWVKMGFRISNMDSHKM